MKPKPTPVQWMLNLGAADLRPTYRGIGAMLIRWADLKTGELYPAVSTIAELTGHAPNTVRRALRALHEAELLDVPFGWSTGGKGGPHRMRIRYQVIPKSSQCAAHDMQPPPAPAHSPPSLSADEHSSEPANELSISTAPVTTATQVRELASYRVFVQSLEAWSQGGIHDDDYSRMTQWYTRFAAGADARIDGAPVTRETLIAAAARRACASPLEWGSLDDRLAYIESICTACIAEHRWPE